METRQELCRRHRAELEKYREDILVKVYRDAAGGDLKESKTVIDILKIYQECERKVLQFEDSAPGDETIAYDFEEVDQ